MKKFLVRLSIFLMPGTVLTLFFIFSLEFYMTRSAAFSLKKNFLEDNLGTIEVLVLGSSHSQNSVNPAFLKNKTSNLAFGSQPISIDYYLLDKYIDQMPKLKIVFIDVSPHRFYKDLNPSDWNGHIYSNLYDIKYNVEQYSVKNHSFFFSHPSFFTKSFLTILNPYSYKYKYNEYGFVVNDFNSRFSQLNYNIEQIDTSYIMPFDFQEIEYKKTNEHYLKMIIKRCKINDIKLIFINTPVYKTFSNKMPVEATQYVDSLMNQYNNVYGTKYYDFSEDKKYQIYDFKNDNHLNSDGAKKFTTEIDSLITINK
jgi:hypothetical protein